MQNKFTFTYNFIQVETSREKIISLELQDPEKSDTPRASIDLMTQHHENVKNTKQVDQSEGEVNENDNQEQMMPPQQTQVSEYKKPGVTSTTLMETVEKFHIKHKYEDFNENYNKKEENENQQDFENCNVDKVVQEEDDNDVDEVVEEEEEEEEETDSASIVTVQQNTEKLFLLNDDELPSIELDGLGSEGIFGPSSLDSISSATKVNIKPSSLTMHQRLAKEVLLPATNKVTTTITTAHSKEYLELEGDEFDNEYKSSATAETTSTPALITTQSKTKNIVEVINPLIKGEGYVQRIAFSRSQCSEYPSFDNDDEQIEEATHGDGNDFENLPSSLQILRSETFVLPTSKSPEELSLNAKMKNVLEELLENERVKYNLRKSLEEQANIDKNMKPAYGDSDDEEEDEHTKDEIDFAVTQTTQDGNGNRHILNSLIRDSNRNTLQRLQSQLLDEVSDDNNEKGEFEVPEEEEEESDGTEESESSDSDDDDYDDDDETIHITFVDGAKVIENFNTNTPLKLQKSQTYNTIKEAAESMTEEPKECQTYLDEKLNETHSMQEDDSRETLGKLLAEQQNYAEMSKQLRKSVENLLADDYEPEATSSTSTTTKTEYQEKQKNKKEVITKKSPKSKPTKQRPDSAITETGEEIFNRLLQAVGSCKEIFDQETDEILTSTTTTCTEDNDTIITTTTTTISNVTTSGIPRKMKPAKNPANKDNDNKYVGEHRDRCSDEEA